MTKGAYTTHQLQLTPIEAYLYVTATINLKTSI